MRPLLDENASAKSFCRALRLAGHDVETVVVSLGSGTDDSRVAEYAMSSRRVLITGDQDDFLHLYRDVADHPGLILVYPTTQRRSSETLARAISNIARLYAEPIGLILSLNDFDW